MSCFCLKVFESLHHLFEVGDRLHDYIVFHGGFSAGGPPSRNGPAPELELQPAFRNAQSLQRGVGEEHLLEVVARLEMLQ